MAGRVTLSVTIDGEDELATVESALRRLGHEPELKYEDPLDDPEYREAWEALAEDCRCSPSYAPCAGVMAGGICDESIDPCDDGGWRDEDSDYFDDDEE